MKKNLILSLRKKKEIVAFSDLASYRKLMSRPYFRDLKEKVGRVLKQYRFKNKKILEIGAGTSGFLSYFDKDNEVTALDISEVLLSQNKTKAKLVVADAENLPFPKASFDFVYLVGVIHHLEDQEKALKEISRVLKTDGQFFMSEPTFGSLNLPYYLIRKLLILIFSEARYKKMSGCGSSDESFINLKLVNEVFGSDFQLKSQKILPLRMPPIGLLESLFPKKLNAFLEKMPLVKNLGTIIFIEGKKLGRKK